ncbi:hypothetical protein LC593_32490 [Nostoc sp. CHAB 5844]|nr:hypothetical protein [Nostoc sp. CHAB 5844]
MGNKIMLILASAAPYVNWGESRAKLFKGLLKEKFGTEISSYQVHKLLVDAQVEDISIAYTKKLMGDSGKNYIAQTVALDKVIKMCKALEIPVDELVPIFEIETPRNFIDPIDLDTNSI